MKPDPEDLKPEETVDPEDWSQVQRLGHRMVDDVIAYLLGA